MMKSSSEHVLRLDPAASSGVLTRAPERKSSVHLPMGAQCAICLFAISDRCSLEACSHEFCRTCLLEWSKLSRDCPLCRRTFNAVQTPAGRLPVPMHEPLLPLASSSREEQEDAEVAEDTMDALLNSPLIAQLSRQFEEDAGASLDCDQINSLLNQLFGHVQMEGEEMQWPF